MKKEKLEFRDIEFEQVYKKRVIKNNRSSGKVQLPPRLIGKEVYIVIP